MQVFVIADFNNPDTYTEDHNNVLASAAFQVMHFKTDPSWTSFRCQTLEFTRLLNKGLLSTLHVHAAFVPAFRL